MSLLRLASSYAYPPAVAGCVAGGGRTLIPSIRTSCAVVIRPNGNDSAVASSSAASCREYSQRGGGEGAAKAAKWGEEDAKVGDTSLNNPNLLTSDGYRRV